MLNSSKVVERKFNIAWITVVLILATVGIYLHSYSQKPVPLKISLDKMPTSLGGWNSVGPPGYDNKPFLAKGAESDIARLFRNSEGKEIEVYIGYFDYQRQNKELVHFNLGPLFKNNDEIETTVDSKGVIKLSKSIYKGDYNTQLVLFWFDINGKIVANRYMAKMLTALDGVFHRRTNGAIVMVFSKLDSPADYSQTLEDELSFIKLIIPILENYFPSS